jgi:hypothetical protein
MNPIDSIPLDWIFSDFGRFRFMINHFKKQEKILLRVPSKFSTSLNLPVSPEGPHRRTFSYTNKQTKKKNYFQ